MKIKLEDVTSKKIKENIEICTEDIKKFLYALKVMLKSTDSIDVDKLSMEIYAKDENAYLDDGNTKCPGMMYNVIWAVDLNGRDIEGVYSKLQFSNNTVENCLYFIFEQGERLTDHKADYNRFLSMYIAGADFNSNRNERNWMRIDYNNGNYDLTSIINPENLTKATIEAKRIKEENETYAAAKAIWKNISM